jgi:hypothetical protein
MGSNSRLALFLIRPTYSQPVLQAEIATLSATPVRFVAIRFVMALVIPLDVGSASIDL